MAYAAVLTAAACFGTFGVFSSLFLNGGGSPFSLVYLRAAVGALAFVGILLVRRERIFSAPLSLAALALGGFQIGASWLLFEGFARSPTSAVVLAFYTYPLLVHIGAVWLFREAIDSVRPLALAAGILGVGLMAGFPGAGSGAGIALGFAGSVLAAGTVLCAKRALASGMSTFQLAAITYLTPAVALSILALRTLDLPTNQGAWVGLAGIVGIGTIVPTLLFYFGIQRLGAATTSLVSLMEPMVAVVLGYVMLAERLTVVQVLGGILVLASAVATIIAGAGIRLPGGSAGRDSA